MLIKFIFFLLLVTGLYACGSGSSEKTALPIADSSKVNTDTATVSWIDDFREFRDAVYHGNVEKAKTFFKFPVLNYGNEIWSFIMEGSDGFSKINASDTTVPFTEKDLDKYFKKLFPARFITSLLKIKSQELVRHGDTETELFEEDSLNTYQMIASYDKDDKTLTLHLHTKTIFKDDKGEVLDVGEGSIVYTFFILPNGHLQFKDLRQAG